MVNKILTQLQIFIMYYFVYQTTNLITNRIYIGVHSTKNLDDGYLGSGRVLQKAIKKHGKENFARTILKFFDTVEDAYQYESEIVTEEFISSPDVYNACVGGIGGMGKSMSLEDRQKYGSIAGKLAVQNKTGIFALTDEERRNNSRKAGLIVGKRAVEEQTGIHALTTEERIAYGKIGAEITSKRYKHSIGYTDGANDFRYTIEEQRILPFEEFLENNPQYTKGSFTNNGLTNVDSSIYKMAYHDGVSNYNYSPFDDVELQFDEFLKK